MCRRVPRSLFELVVVSVAQSQKCLESTIVVGGVRVRPGQSWPRPEMWFGKNFRVSPNGGSS